VRSLLKRWYRLLGIAGEPVSFHAQVPPGVAWQRLERTFPMRQGAPVRGRRWQDGLKVGRTPALPGLDERPQAYLRLFAEGDGTRVEGVVRAGGLARFVWACAPLTLPSMVGSVVTNAGDALRDGGVFAWSQTVVPLLVVLWSVQLLVANRGGKRRLREWLTRTVRG
jgi:hypothetical protein